MRGFLVGGTDPIGAYGDGLRTRAGDRSPAYGAKHGDPGDLRV